MSSRAVCAVLLALSLAACGRDGEPTGVISRERFVAANVALRTLPATAPVEQRRAVLKKQGVTDGELQAWLRAHSRDTERLALTWEEIAHKVDSLSNPRPDAQPTSPDAALVKRLDEARRGGDSTPPVAPPPPPPGPPQPTVTVIAPRPPDDAEESMRPSQRPPRGTRVIPMEKVQ